MQKRRTRPSEPEPTGHEHRIRELTAYYTKYPWAPPGQAQVPHGATPSDDEVAMCKCLMRAAAAVSGLRLVDVKYCTRVRARGGNWESRKEWLTYFIESCLRMGIRRGSISMYLSDMQTEQMQCVREAPHGHAIGGFPLHARMVKRILEFESHETPQGDVQDQAQDRGRQRDPGRHEDPEDAWRALRGGPVAIRPCIQGTGPG